MAKRYYWLKLKENFFAEEDIKLLESMDNGKDYIIFLLKLRLKAINTNGALNFKGIMPYNEKMLATVTDTNIDIVRAALSIFEELGLITKMDDGTIYMEQVERLIGSESESLERVRKHREKLKLLPEKALQCNGSVTKCNTDIDIEKDIDTMANDMFEAVWQEYPRKLGKGSVSKKQKKRLYAIGKEELLRCIARFKEHMASEGRPIDKYPYGSTFFNSAYIDYLDQNYAKPSKKWEVTD